MTTLKACLRFRLASLYHTPRAIRRSSENSTVMPFFLLALTRSFSILYCSSKASISAVRDLAISSLVIGVLPTLHEDSVGVFGSLDVVFEEWAVLFEALVVIFH